jgi:large subunit ribosomal protein L7/L12
MSDKISSIIDQLKTLTLLEASELVKEIETVFESPHIGQGCDVTT